MKYILSGDYGSWSPGWRFSIFIDLHNILDEGRRHREKKGVSPILSNPLACNGI